MIFTSVDVEALRYLHAKGEGFGGLARTLIGHISYGYQRELRYRHQDGWFAAKVRPGVEGSLWLTSYCLSVFSKARQFATIDENILSSAAQWIINHQKADGGWQPVGFVHNQRLFGGLSGDYALTAFVTLALAGYLGTTDAILNRARLYLETHLADAESPHSIAMGAYALALLESPAAEQALDRLQSLAQTSEEGGIYWEPVPVETTGYASLACNEGGRLVPATAAASWLVTQKNSRGGFGNTQDTVMALRALVQDALSALESTEVSVRIERGEELLHTTQVNASNFDVVQTFSIAPGPDLTVSTSGQGPLSLQLAKIFHVPTETLASRGGLTLRVDYDNTRIAAGDTVHAEASITYRGATEVTNLAIAEIGIPTGLRPDRAELDRLVGTGKIDRIDVARRTITVYLDSIAKGETITIPITYTAAFRAQAEPVPSKSYDYYDDAVEALDEGITLVIGERGQEISFVRGDANEDSRVDMSDAIGILDYLFRDPPSLTTCLDAIDANDDGTTDISDPIYLLVYLFAGGLPPPRPYPQLGDDPTEDTLRCMLE